MKHAFSANVRATTGKAMSHENETLRWPTNLDHAAIVARLVEVRTMAAEAGLADFAARFADVEKMTSAHIGASVVAALTWIQDKPEYHAITTQLAMVAMNLKNL
jgi:hypothetical protein